jgi:hypothetical protein
MLKQRRARGRELTGLVQDLAQLAPFGGRLHDLAQGAVSQVK